MCIKFKNNARSEILAAHFQSVHKHLHTSNTVICLQMAQTDCTAHTLHTHIYTFQPALCPSWQAGEGDAGVNVTDESTLRKKAPHNNTGGLSYFYLWPRAWTGWASLQPRDTWL